MEQAMLWVTAVGAIIIPVVGWIFNTLITNKIDALNKRCDELEALRKEEKELFFTRLDAIKTLISNEYVRKEMYVQAMEFHQKEVDAKFNSLIDSINKLDKDVKDRFDDVKDLINEKFNGKNKGE